MMTHPRNRGSISLYASQVRIFLLYYPLLPLVSGSCTGSLLRSASNDAKNQYQRNMHTFKFTLLAVLSYVAMIGATPLGKRDPPSPPAYVLLITARGGSDPIENISPAQSALTNLTFRSAGSANTNLSSRNAEAAQAAQATLKTFCQFR
ncbi:hypothetical protein F5888DRAFT_1740788 [Russula emetica]|nr:hypothetical protein F5888DRAFT_1740788 [Russula emetica]